MKQVSFILLFVALTLPLPGQDLPSRAIPDQYGYNRFWSVLSDREDNPCYKYPDGTEKNSNLQFLEQFMVAEMEGEYLHIYKDPGNVHFPAISSRAISYGWIHRDFLLLDNSSKKIAGAVLLANSELLRLDPENPGSILAGWYPSSQVEVWANRVVLEPNWEQRAFQERQANDIIPTVFSSRSAAEEYYLGGEVSASSILWINEPGARRNNGEWKRFPILETDDRGICKVRVFESRDQQNDGYFSYEGFTCLNVLGNNYPIFKPVLFSTNDHLVSLLSNLQKLVFRQAPMYTKRKQMQNVWLDLLEAHLGSLNREEVLSYSLDEINEIVNDGIPMQSTLLKSVRLQDITDPNVVSDVIFERYMSYLGDKINSLRIIMSEEYDQSYFADGLRYYWIPFEDFP